MKGTLYGVGVGPGDPELMTVKACRLIRENEVIAAPGRGPESSVAYQIAVQAVPELKRRKVIFLEMPMVRDEAVLGEYRGKGARLLEEQLDEGRNVVFLTLGDPAFYSTFSYLQELLEKDGYETAAVSGVTSVSAAAAALHVSLAKGDEPVVVLPSAHSGQIDPDDPATYVLMKSGSHMKEIRSILQSSGRDVKAVENCGMEAERIYESLDEMPERAGYLSVIISRRKA